MCPAEEDSGMLILSVFVSNNMCGQEVEKRGQWGSSKGTKNEAVDYEHGVSKGRSSQLHTKTHHSQ
jgi:hypothetical protein